MAKCTVRNLNICSTSKDENVSCHLGIKTFEKRNPQEDFYHVCRTATAQPGKLYRVGRFHLDPRLF